MLQLVWRVRCSHNRLRSLRRRLRGRRHVGDHPPRVGRSRGLHDRVGRVRSSRGLAVGCGCRVRSRTTARPGRNPPAGWPARASGRAMAPFTLTPPIAMMGCEGRDALDKCTGRGGVLDRGGCVDEIRHRRKPSPVVREICARIAASAASCTLASSIRPSSHSSDTTADGRAATEGLSRAASTKKSATSSSLP